MDDYTSTTLTTIQSEDASGAGSSETGPLAPSPQAGIMEGDLLEDTLLENLALSSVESASTITGAMERNLLGGSDIEVESVENVHTSSVPPKPQAKRLSGAARRRRKREVAAQAEGGQMMGEAALAIPHQDQPTSPTGRTPATTSELQAQTGAARKRVLHTGSTPKEMKPAAKKKKTEYSQTVQKSLQVAVVFKDNPTRKILENEKGHIWRQLVQLIDMTPHHSGPRFDRSGLVQGVYRITCADQASLTWLRVAVPRIEPIEGQGFTVVELSQLNRMTNIRVWIPGEKSDPHTILSRPAKQNRGLDTTEWRLIYRQEKENGQLLVLG